MLSRSIVSDSLQPHGVGSFSMGLSRQEYWSGLPFPPPGDLPIQQSNLGLRCLLHCRHVPYQWTTGEASFSTTFILSFSVTFFFLIQLCQVLGAVLRIFHLPLWRVGSFLVSLLFSRSIMFDSLRPYELQHSRLPCHSLSPGVCSNSCPLSQRCHSTISSSVTHFSCPQSFPASGSFPMSQFFPSGGQSIGASASTSVFPMNIQGWFPLGWSGWISLLSKRLSRVFSNTIVQKNQFFGIQLSL